MRIFIALEIPEKIKKEIGKIQNHLKTAGIQARWVKPEIIHLTLIFLGETVPNKVGGTEKILKEVSSQISPVNLWLEKIDAFPSPNKVKIIHFSLKGEADKLNTLVLKIQKCLKKQKINFDQKPFVPHLTLGRLKKPQNLTSYLSKIKIPHQEFFVHQLSLIQSTLTPQGPIYKNFASFELKAKNC
jgi:2'-5' RNA ligase